MTHVRVLHYSPPPTREKEEEEEEDEEEEEEEEGEQLCNRYWSNKLTYTSARACPSHRVAQAPGGQLEGVTGTVGGFKVEGAIGTHLTHGIFLL